MYLNKKVFFNILLDKSQVSNLQKSEIKINTNDNSEIIQLSTLENYDLVYLKYFDTNDNVSVVRYNDVKFLNNTIHKVINEQCKLIYYLKTFNLWIKMFIS